MYINHQSTGGSRLSSSILTRKHCLVYQLAQSTTCSQKEGGCSTKGVDWACQFQEDSSCYDRFVCVLHFRVLHNDWPNWSSDNPTCCQIPFSVHQLNTVLKQKNRGFCKFNAIAKTSIINEADGGELSGIQHHSSQTMESNALEPSSGIVAKGSAVTLATASAVSEKRKHVVSVLSQSYIND